MQVQIVLVKALPVMDALDGDLSFDLPIGFKLALPELYASDLVKMGYAKHDTQESKTMVEDKVWIVLLVNLPVHHVIHSDMEFMLPVGTTYLVPRSTAVELVANEQATMLTGE